MYELISLQPHDTLIQAVSARELHTFLQNRDHFATWIRDRIAQYDFVESQDFVCVSENSETQRANGQRGVTTRKEYYITLDMAKELSMVERNEQGKQARKYFIECERRLKGSMTRLSYAQALRAYADEVEAREKLEQQLALAEPKVEYFDALVSRNLLLNFTTVAKELGVKRKVLIGYLIENKYVYRDSNNNLLPYSQHTPHLFEVKEYTKDNYSGVQTLITPRGRETFRLLLSGLPSV